MLVGLEKFHISTPADIQIAQSRVRRLTVLRPHPELLARILTVIAELGSNMCKYASRGWLSLNMEQYGSSHWFVIVAEDKGPGIPDAERAMRDHYSSGGTLGLGLPGVRRLADEFALESLAGGRTRVRAALRVGNPPVPPCRPPRMVVEQVTCGSRVELAWAVRPLSSEIVAGDAAIAIQEQDRLGVVLVDATGHGPAAHEVAKRALACVREAIMSGPVRCLQRLHEVLAGTRGAAASAMLLQLSSGELEYAAVGNTGAYRCVGTHWHPVSGNGMLGMRLPGLRPDRISLAADDLLLLRTDGLPELASQAFIKRHAREASAWLASRLLQELGKPHDDAACVVMKWR